MLIDFHGNCAFSLPNFMTYRASLWDTIRLLHIPLYSMAILSFACADTQSLFDGKRVGRFVNIERVAMRKLAMLNRAVTLQDLRVPPGNRLKPLTGDRATQHSIRIDDQFRVCFVWLADGPANVRIIDYH
ncbi:MAG: proteic killer suppression protein [Candidatus Kentron sp. G]|nr:MAG: proteic killer suppression protein [Candidatus Kentron sp. G]VFN07274.1 MAG: proteic killer suppression protein [Candidatus Kentron sp. G]